VNFGGKTVFAHRLFDGDCSQDITSIDLSPLALRLVMEGRLIVYKVLGSIASYCGFKSQLWAFAYTVTIFGHFGKNHTF